MTAKPLPDKDLDQSPERSADPAPEQPRDSLRLTQTNKPICILCHRGKRQVHRLSNRNIGDKVRFNFATMREEGREFIIVLCSTCDALVRKMKRHARDMSPEQLLENAKAYRESHPIEDKPRAILTAVERLARINKLESSHYCVDCGCLKRNGSCANPECIRNL